MAEDNFNRFVQMLNMAWKLLLEHRVRRPNMQIVLSFLERFMALVPQGETKVEKIPVYIYPPWPETKLDWEPSQPYVYEWKYLNSTSINRALNTTISPSGSSIRLWSYDDKEPQLGTTENTVELSASLGSLFGGSANTSTEKLNIGYDKKKKEWYVK